MNFRQDVVRQPEVRIQLQGFLYFCKGSGVHSCMMQMVGQDAAERHVQGILIDLELHVGRGLFESSKRIRIKTRIRPSGIGGDRTRCERRLEVLAGGRPIVVVGSGDPAQ
jgi:hypothetical protein